MTVKIVAFGRKALLTMPTVAQTYYVVSYVFFAFLAM